MSFWGKNSCFLRWGVSCLFVALSVVQLNAGYVFVESIELTKSSEFSGVFAKIKVMPYNPGSTIGGKVIVEDNKKLSFDNRCIETMWGNFELVDGVRRDLSFALPNSGCAVHVPTAGQSFEILDDDGHLTRALLEKMNGYETSSNLAILKTYFDGLITGSFKTLPKNNEKCYYAPYKQTEFGNKTVRVNAGNHGWILDPQLAPQLIEKNSEFFVELKEQQEAIAAFNSTQHTGAIASDRVAVRPTGSGSVSDQYWSSTENLLALSLEEQPTALVPGHSYSFGDVSGAAQAYQSMEVLTDEQRTARILQKVAGMGNIFQVSIKKKKVFLTFQDRKKRSLSAEFECKYDDRSDNYTSTFCFTHDGKELRMMMLTPNPERGHSVVTDGGAYYKIYGDSKKAFEEVLLSNLKEAQHLT